MRTRATRRWWRFAAAAALAACISVAATLTGAAATLAFTVTPTAGFPAGPIHLTQGDLIDVSIPIAAGPGVVVDGSMRPPPAKSSDSAVLPRISSSYDSAFTSHSTFQAAHAGTAELTAGTLSLSVCPGPSPSTTSSTSTASSTSSSSTSSSSSATPPPSHVCAAGVLDSVTVIVSAVGTQGVTTPSVGSGGLPGVGFWLLLGGLAAAVAALRRFGGGGYGR